MLATQVSKGQSCGCQYILMTSAPMLGQSTCTERRAGACATTADAMVPWCLLAAGRFGTGCGALRVDSDGKSNKGLVVVVLSEGML